jgi:hypothetical protein
MSGPENFIARWSRRKRAGEGASDPAAGPVEPAADNPSVIADQPGAATPEQRGTPAGTTPSNDLTQLPPIESITASTDIRAFLAPGVPAELARAALRRAWTADPAIRDFVGLADYDWDFNNPSSITGFGTLEMTDELRQQVARIIGHRLAGDESDQPAPTSPEPPVPVEIADKSVASVRATDEVPAVRTESNMENSQGEAKTSSSDRYNSEAIPKIDEQYVAVHNYPAAPDDAQVIAKRLHGRALPK